MSDCKLTIRDVFECPICGRQTVLLDTEPVAAKPFICDFGHSTVEMEQKLRTAYRAEFQNPFPEEGKG